MPTLTRDPLLLAAAYIQRRRVHKAIQTGPEGPTPFQSFQLKYRDDPAGFVTDCIAWPKNKRPARYQLSILSNLVKYQRECARGPRGLGKTTTEALAILWFCLTRDGWADWKCITTAGTGRQLYKYLWPEVHKWARLIRWDVIGRPPLTSPYELQLVGIRLTTGQAFAVSSDKPELVEGAHADELFYLFDESKAIRPDVWDATEGAYSGADQRVLILAASTPGEPNGRFWEIQTKKPGFMDWHVDVVSLADTFTEGRLSQPWAQARLEQWGEGSALYQNQVLGQFAASEESGVIPSSWVEAAFDRWREWDEAGRPNLGPLDRVGVDVARSGSDKTVIAPCAKNLVIELRKYAHNTITTTTGLVAGVLGQVIRGGSNPIAVVDVIGLGAGVVDNLREQGFSVHAFNASAHSDMLDRSGELGFANRRSEAWWTTRERLDPERGDEIALPPDDELLGELCAPHWRIQSGGKILVESKDEIKKRLGRSTDSADAVIQALSNLEESGMSVWSLSSGFGGEREW